MYTAEILVIVIGFVLLCHCHYLLTDPRNKPFNLDELKEAISKSHDTATGPDEIHYQMLKHLTPKSLQTLLDIFSDIWDTGRFPERWELATIIPIPKPGKDHAEPIIDQ